MKTRWIQFNIGLIRKDGKADESARLLFQSLLSYIYEARCFFFMRKPPDVRLRFQVEQDSFAPKVEQDLGHLVHSGIIRSFISSIYEPEFHLFGGKKIMPHIHEHFQADSLMWLELGRLIDEGHEAASLDSISLALMNDLFLQSLAPNREEIWDVWKNIQCLLPLAGEGGEEIGIITIDSLKSILSSKMHVSFDNYREANQKLASAFARLGSKGELESGIRAILAFVALFHYNRFGLSTRARRIADSMVNAWDPRSGLIGKDPDLPERWEAKGKK